MTPRNSPPLDVVAEIARGTPGRCAHLAAEDAEANSTPLTWLRPGFGLASDERGVTVAVTIAGITFRGLIDAQTAETVGSGLVKHSAYAYQAESIASARSAAQGLPS